MKLYIKYQTGLGLLLSDNEIFKVFFPIWVYVKQVNPGAGPFLARLYEVQGELFDGLVQN